MEFRSTRSDGQLLYIEQEASRGKVNYDDDDEDDQDDDDEEEEEKEEEDEEGDDGNDDDGDGDSDGDDDGQLLYIEQEANRGKVNYDDEWNDDGD